MMVKHIGILDSYEHPRMPIHFLKCMGTTCPNMMLPCVGFPRWALGNNSGIGPYHPCGFIYFDNICRRYKEMATQRSRA